MDLSIRDNLNKLCDLLETLANLQVTYAIDKVHYNENTGKFTVYYIHGVYKEKQ